jgi:hypothetical protein
VWHIVAGVALAVLVLGALPTIASASGTSLVATDCNEQNGIVLYPAALMSGRVPPGFTVSSGGLGPGLAAVLVDGFSCRFGGVPATALFVFVAVEPPARYRTPGASDYLVMLQGWVSSSTVAQSFRAMGLSSVVQQAKVMFASLTLPTGQRVGSVRKSGTPDEQLATAGFDPPSTIPAGGARGFVPLPGGKIAALDVSWSQEVGQDALAAATQLGAGPLPLPVGAGPAGVAWDYTLTLTSATLP